jgi:hypothetical protein
VTVGKIMLSELAPLVDAQQGAFYMAPTRDATAALLGCSPATPTASASTSASASPSARAWSASARSRRSASCSPTCPPTTSASQLGLGEAPPKNIVVLPVLFEGRPRR